MRKFALACLKLVTAASFAISMGFTAATPASAFSGDQWQHIMDCAGWMFSDPARHDAECGPGHTGDITSDSRGWSFETTPTPAPKECQHVSSFQSGAADPLLTQVIIQLCCDDDSEVPCHPVSLQLGAPTLRELTI